MPELILQKNAPEKANIAYSNKYLKDDYPSGYPYTGAWEPKLQQTTQVTHYSITAAVNQEEYDTLIRDSFEKEDPFTQTDLLDCEENEIQELIFRIRTSHYIHRESLANRLVTLFKDAKEEDPASPGISLGSLRNFYNFLKLHRNLKYPAISLTPDYNIYVSWRGEQNQVFSVHFLSDRVARFVVLKPNERHPEQQIRVSGTMTTDILMEKMEPYGVWDWVRNERG